MKLHSIRMAANGPLVGLMRDVGEYDLWSTSSRRERAYAVVEGPDAGEAFRRGWFGKGEPLWKCAPRTPLFDRMFAGHRDPTARYEDLKGKPIEPNRWVTKFFREHHGWVPADDVGVVLRFAHDLGEREQEWARDPAFQDGRVRSRMCDREMWRLVLASLTEPGESLVEDPNFGPVGLGEDPVFAAVCTRAVALLYMGEVAPEYKLAVLKLPKPKAGSYKRFLFFGQRAVF